MRKTRIYAMRACAALLCVMMASIFLRFFTVQVLVKRMRLDNVFTRAVLFDAEELRQLRNRETPIDWVALYPFRDTEKKTEAKKSAAPSNGIMQQVNAKIQAANKKIKSYEKRIKAYTSTNLMGYMVGVKWANAYKQAIGWNIPVVSGYNSVAEIQDGQLTTFVSRKDTESDASATIDFARYCERQGAKFFYIAAFDKIGRDNTSYNGTIDFSNQNTDKFLASLAQASVGYIDLRDYVAELGEQHCLFYRTDHHWRAETGLWAAGKIAAQLGACGFLDTDVSMLREENFKKEIYSNWFLGSHGKKFTLARTTPDNIALLYPKFETSIHYVIPGLVDKTGNFDVIYQMRHIEIKDYYKQNPYAAYNYADRPYISIDNLLANNSTKILVVKDSFANCVTPFLALQCRHMDILDLRQFNGSVKTFIAVTKPDVVLVLYRNASIGGRGKQFQFR